MTCTLFLLGILLFGFSLPSHAVRAQPLSWESLNSSGMGAYRQQQYDQAKSLFLQALAAIPAQTVPDARMATTLNNLGATHKALGEYDQAVLRYQHSLAIVEAIQGPAHPDVAVGLNNLAALHFDFGVYDQAELLWLRGLTIYEEHLGVEHPHLVPSLQTLALVTQMQEKFEESERYYRRTLKIIEDSLGKEHKRLIPILEQYAHLLRITQREPEAAIVEGRAEIIRSRPLGPTP